MFISKAEEIGMSAALKKDDRPFSPLQDKINTRKIEIKYFKDYRLGTFTVLPIQQEISITSPSLPDEKISDF